jgi:L-asparaginase/Glu-tRNA(Gln) amidotransferase subunit D
MNVGVITTGGTIAGAILDNVVAAVSRGDSEAVNLVGAASSGTQLLLRSPLSVMSENMVPSDWVAIAQSVRELATQPDVQGVLVLHGTDTAIFTTAALSFMCADLPIPVILTGANLPADAPGSDAMNNVHGAVTALTRLERGCFLSFAGSPQATSTVFSGTHVRKLHAGGQPYKSVGVPDVAWVTPDGSFEANRLSETLLTTPPVTSPVHVGVDTRVGLWSLHPGIDFQALQYLTKEHDYRAIVIELYGSLSAPTGTAPMDCAQYVSWCRKRGVAVFGCPHEPPVGTLLDYESTISLRDSGMIIAENMLPEVAFVKAAWASSAANDREELVRRFVEPVVAEFIGRQETDVTG